jgi:hypothetical protein
MPTEPEIVTLSQVVERAADVVDPDGADQDIADFVARHEDDDEPVTAIEDIELRLAESAGALDPQQENGMFQVMVALATYLAFRRDELNDDPDELIRLAVRAEFNDDRPASVNDWLALNAIEV